MDKSKKFISKEFTIQKPGKDPSDYKRRLENDIAKFLKKETGMCPMVIVHFITM